jgi:DNA-binding FrmR family transcriptional regulator
VSRGVATTGYIDDEADLLARLARIGGKIRGLSRMVGRDTYCIDMPTQVSSTTRALQTVALALLEDHLTHCVI